MTIRTPSAPALVLASASTARRQVLMAAGLQFYVQPSHIDEAAIKRQYHDAHDAAPALALAKAATVNAPGALILGCDQILQCDGRNFDKPTDLDDAKAHLRFLRGKRHELVTAICGVQNGREIWRHTAVPSLTMRDFSDDFLDRYIAAEGDAVLGSVGAYRLEGLGYQLFSQISGEQAAILGVPLLALLDFLRQTGAVAT